MSYRKIEVNGKTYEYVIGQVNIKIKGVGVFSTVETSDKAKDGEREFEEYIAVTPKDIRELILKHES